MAGGNLDSIEEVYHYLSAAFHHSCMVGMPDMLARIEHQALHFGMLMGMLMWVDTVAARPRPPIDSDAVFQETQDFFQYWAEVIKQGDGY